VHRLVLDRSVSKCEGHATALGLDEAKHPVVGSTGEANGSITCTITDSTGRVIGTAKASGPCDGSKP
jgi:hypothetical protein